MVSGAFPSSCVKSTKSNLSLAGVRGHILFNTLEYAYLVISRSSDPTWQKVPTREWQKARDATVNLSVDGEGSVNVALGKPVQVSSAFVEDGQEYGGAKAVNGSKDGWDNRWVCRKDDETPWIEVDLEGTKTIYDVAHCTRR